MIKKLYLEYYADRTVPERVVLLTAASIFLPYYITALFVICCAFYLLFNKARRREMFRITSPYMLILPAACLLTLTAPLFFKNYFGFYCAIYLLFALIVAVCVKSATSPAMLSRVCDLSCAMTIADLVAVVVQKISAPADRVVGMTYNANFYAFLLEFVILFAFYRMLMEKRNRLFYIVVVAVDMVQLLFTDCRTAWVALLAGLLVLFLLQNKKRLIPWLAVAACAFAAAALFIPGFLPRATAIDPTLTVRQEIWKDSFKDFLHHPVFGRGFLAFLQVSGAWVKPHAHDLILDLLECTGIVGTTFAITYFTIGSGNKDLSFHRMWCS